MAHNGGPRPAVVVRAAAGKKMTLREDPFNKQILANLRSQDRAELGRLLGVVKDSLNMTPNTGRT